MATPGQVLMLFFVMLAVCALLTARLVYRYDLYEHEPVPLLGVAIALGAGAMWCAGLIEDVILVRSGATAPLGVALVAAGTEETLKLFVVIVVAVLARREFDDPMDGIVYGSMAGLGAAVEESVFYRHLAANDPVALPAAELVRIWAHLVLGGIVGFPLGFWRARAAKAAAGVLGALGLAMGFHLGWDAVALSTPLGGTPSALATALGVALMIACLGVYGRLVVVASSRSRAQFAPRSVARLWGWPFNRRCHSHAPPPDDTTPAATA